MCSGGCKIADDESIETINGKIDLQSRMNSPFKDRMLWYIDVEEPDGSENFDANPAGVTHEGEEYTLTIVSRVREGQHTYYPEDWHYWCGMMSVYYDCLIKFKKD